MVWFCRTEHVAGAARCSVNHKSLWRGLSRLADERRITKAELARRAGLCGGRLSGGGEWGNKKLRWPSTETLAAVLDSVGMTLGQFAAMIGDVGPPAEERMPLITWQQAQAEGYFNAIRTPTLTGAWDSMLRPRVMSQDAYAIQLVDDTLFPTYRDGDILIACPDAPIRRGDRVLVHTDANEVLGKEVVVWRNGRLLCHSLNPLAPNHPLTPESILAVHRIIWVSQ